MTRLPRLAHGRPGLLLLASTTALCGWVGTARAQTAPPPAHGNLSGAPIEEVTVTARHRKEKAQSVPIAITSIAAKQLSDIGVTSVAQVGQLAPSLQVTETNPRNTSFNIRGIGNDVSQTSDGLEGGVGNLRGWRSARSGPAPRRSGWPTCKACKCCAARRAPCSARTPPPAPSTCTHNYRPSPTGRMARPASAITASGSSRAMLPAQ